MINQTVLDKEFLAAKFERIGARIKVRPRIKTRSFVAADRRMSRLADNSESKYNPITIDIGYDRRGEFFDIQTDDAVRVEIIDVKPKERHLLLMVRQPAAKPEPFDTQDKFLCGHDERHWFVSGISETAPVSSVVAAKEALRPKIARNLRCGQKEPQFKCIS